VAHREKSLRPGASCWPIVSSLRLRNEERKWVSLGCMEKSGFLTFYFSKTKQTNKKIPSNLKIEFPFLCFPFKITNAKSQEMLKLIRLFVVQDQRCQPPSSYKKGYNSGWNWNCRN